MPPHPFFPDVVVVAMIITITITIIIIIIIIMQWLYQHPAFKDSTM